MASPSETGNARRPLNKPVVARQSLLYIMLIVIALIYIFPFLIQIFTIFKTDSDTVAHPLSLLPTTWTAQALKTLFFDTGNYDFPVWAMNSAIVTLFVTVGRVMFDSMAGYALARLHYRGRNAVFAGLVAIMAVPNVVLMIPKFLVIRELGIFNTYPGMIIPLLVDATGVFIMKGFFESIPVSIEEAARVDGASPFRTFWSVTLPMARSALITIIILSFQGSWNELEQFIVSTNSPSLMTLTLGVASLNSGQLGATKHYPLQLAAATLMTIPVAVLFFIFQKRIMNVGEGAVKE